MLSWAQCCVHIVHVIHATMLRSRGSSFHEFETGMWRGSLFRTACLADSEPGAEWRPQS